MGWKLVPAALCLTLDSCAPPMDPRREISVGGEVMSCEALRAITWGEFMARVDAAQQSHSKLDWKAIERCLKAPGKGPDRKG